MNKHMMNNIGLLGILVLIMAMLIACESGGETTPVGAGSSNFLYAWGYNLNGQLGIGNTDQQNTPVKMRNKTWTQVSGKGHTMAIDTAGKLYTWGWNGRGQLGNGESGSGLKSTTPVPITITADPTKTWKQVSAGISHSMAIDTAGKLYAWGSNSDGQLGIGNTDQQNTPIAVVIATDTTKTWKFVSAGFSHTVAIDTAGKLYAWGENTYGQLGIGNTTDHNAPVKVGDKTWDQVSTQGREDLLTLSFVRGITVAIDTAGKLYAWGDNNWGQLGIGTETVNGQEELVAKYVPAEVTIGTDTTKTWKQVSAGERHVVAIDNVGKLYAWGHNGQGRLGNGNTDQQNTPAAIEPTKSWIQVSAGNTHTVAIDSDGSLYVWGNNDLGQLGNGNTTAQNTIPVKIGDKTWTQVSAGIEYTIGIIQ